MRGVLHLEKSFRKREAAISLQEKDPCFFSFSEETYVYDPFVSMYTKQNTSSSLKKKKKKKPVATTIYI